MRTLWLAFTTVLLAAIMAGLCFLIPAITRRGLLFGVYVGEQIGGGEQARRITRSSYRGLACWWVGGLGAAAIVGPLFHHLLAAPVAVSVLSLGYLVEYLRAYCRARRLAPEAGPPAAVAFLAAEPSGTILLPSLALALGLAGGVSAVGYAWVHYSEHPDRVPTHFGITGEPDAWRPRSFFTVMLTPILTVTLGPGLAGVAFLIGRAKRAVRYPDHGESFRAQQRFRLVMSRFMALVSILTTAMLSVLSVSAVRVGLGAAQALPPTMPVLAAGLVIGALGGTLYIALRYGQGGSRLERAAAEAPLTDGLADNRRWVLGMFYVNRDDPSYLIEHRSGLGYTINFGNWKAVALVVGFVALVLGIAVAGVLTN
jgi:uncharacterized membrane protein